MKRIIALVWLLAVMLMLADLGWKWRSGLGAALDTDLHALLPEIEGAASIREASRRFSEQLSGRVLVLVRGGHWSHTQRLADGLTQRLQNLEGVSVQHHVRQEEGSATLRLYFQYRSGLLSSSQRQQMRNGDDDALAQMAARNALRPMSLLPDSQWREDPFALFPAWLQQTLGNTAMTVKGGRLVASAADGDWALLMLEPDRSGFSVHQAPWLEALSNALGDVRSAGGEVLAGGAPLFASSAALVAQREASLIGGGSLLGIVVLLWLAFRRGRALLGIVVSLSVGYLTAFSVTLWLFGSVHLLTLVFGATLIGIAQDYGLHYLAKRQAFPGLSNEAILAGNRPTLLFAAFTSALAYLCLVAAPFPGVAQMGVFCASGLLASVFTVLAWFPLLDRRRALPASRLDGLSSWLTLRVRSGAARAVLSLGLLAMLVGGLAFLSGDDDVRLLYSAPDDLLADQARINELVRADNPSRFYLVDGADVQQALERAEALSEALNDRVAQHDIEGFSSVSQWVPSTARQVADRGLIGERFSAAKPIIEELLASPVPAIELSSATLTPGDALSHPGASPWRHLWIGRLDGRYMSVVTLKGEFDSEVERALASLAAETVGVSWVNRVASSSSLLERYRHELVLWLLIAYLLVAVGLYSRFHTGAWRILFAPLLGSLGALAVLGWLNQPINLFHVLALVLILGIGVDYGVFLAANRSRARVAARTAVLLGALSTMLAFGLLALSSTPALAAFGVTILLAMSATLLIALSLFPAAYPGPENPI